MGRKRRPTAIERYWTAVAELGCIVTGRPAQICHVIGKPSVTERVQEPKPKGKKLVRHDWLVIPLAPELHRMMDNDPHNFERQYGPVAKMVDRVIELLRVPVWEYSQKGRK